MPNGNIVNLTRLFTPPNSSLRADSELDCGRRRSYSRCRVRNWHRTRAPRRWSEPWASWPSATMVPRVDRSQAARTGIRGAGAKLAARTARDDVMTPAGRILCARVDVDRLSGHAVRPPTDAATPASPVYDVREAAAVTVPPRPEEPRAAKAYSVFDTYCARCHQTGRLETAAGLGRPRQYPLRSTSWRATRFW